MTDVPAEGFARVANLLTWARAGLLAVLAAIVTLLLTTAPAAAHINLVSSDPREGATLARTPQAVTLTFDEPGITLGAVVIGTGPTGHVESGNPDS